METRYDKTESVTANAPSEREADKHMEDNNMGSIRDASVLQEAKKLISSEENWSIGWFARDRDEDQVEAESQEAVSFCAMGAIMRVCDDRGYASEADRTYTDMVIREYLRPNTEDITGIDDRGGVVTITRDCATFNDSSSHAEVMEWFDRAISSAMPR